MELDMTHHSKLKTQNLTKFKIQNLMKFKLRQNTNDDLK